ncbi:lysoplasmalogenase family protein [Winogradskyella sp. MIT101101]|uniref:lysoplasmalogenase family protein n=1 Tax=Winogradskyella sp. MIT101101 TaxID=3098297 RepID=UPI0039996851
MRKILSYHFIGYLTLIIVVVIINIALKYGDDSSYYRYFIKPIVPALILHYFFKNIRNYKREKAVLVVFGILLFFLGDLFFLDRYSVFSFNMAIVMLIFAKICFIVRFLNHEDFKIKRIIPFLIFCSLYILFILTAIINNIKDIYFVQVLVYLFITLLFGLFTYLRYRAVNKVSFVLVLIGYLLILVVDGLSALNMFTPGFQYNLFSSTIIALAFNLSQFFIVVGLLKETPEIS